MPDNKKRNNLNQRNNNSSKARAEKQEKQTLAFERSGKSTGKEKNSTTRRNGTSTDNKVERLEKNHKKPRYFAPNKNIHKDVKTTVKTREKSTSEESRLKNNKLVPRNGLHHQQTRNKPQISNKEKPKNNQRRKRRINVSFNRPGVIVIASLVLLLFLYFTFVLFRMQILNHQEMTELANNQYYRKIKIPPKRGDILDRNGKVLATTTNVFRVGITPKHVYSLSQSQTESEIVDTVSGILEMDKAEFAGYLADIEKDYIQIRKDVPQDKADLLDQYLAINQIGGFRLDAEPERVYLNEDVASQVIGFSGLNEDTLEGRLGIEYYLNDVLAGSAGYSYGARDNYLNQGDLPFSESAELSTNDGNTVTLTIDYEINKKLQENVREAVDLLDAGAGGMGLVMDVNTGEVLAMASYPYFASSDPTAEQTEVDFSGTWDPSGSETIDILSEHYWRNKVISDVFEVGSTFKTLTLAMGLEENITSEETIYSDDPIDVLDYTIKCWTEEGHGHETLADAFLNSCNPPFVQVGLNLGIDKFYEYVDAFGFNQLSGVELPGEARNIFHENPSLIDLATLSFGEQSGLNLMSFSKGLASVVNGGNLMTPTIIKQISNPAGTIVKTAEPKIERRVISEKTSDRVNQLLSRNDIMQGVNKVSAGYQLGGKTSTSVNEFTEELTMSYVSFAPIDDPEIMVIIVAQNVGNGELGSNSLISNVSGIVDYTLDHMHIERNYQSQQLDEMQQMVEVPDISGKTLEQLKAELNRQAVEVFPGVESMKTEDYIATIVPAPGTPIHYGSRIYAYPTMEIPEDPVPLPDFRGKNYNECLIAANSAGLVPQFIGDMSGLAVEQTIGESPQITEPEQETDPNVETPGEVDQTTPSGTTDQQSENKIEFVQRGTMIKITLQSETDDQGGNDG